MYFRLGRGNTVGQNQYCEQTSGVLNTPTDFYLRLGSYKQNTLNWIVQLPRSTAKRCKFKTGYTPGSRGSIWTFFFKESTNIGMSMSDFLLKFILYIRELSHLVCGTDLNLKLYIFGCFCGLLRESVNHREGQLVSKDARMGKIWSFFILVFYDKHFCQI